MADPGVPGRRDAEQSTSGQAGGDKSSRTASRAKLTIVLIAVVSLGSIACMCAFIFTLVAV